MFWWLCYLSIFSVYAKKLQKKIKPVPDFDVLSYEPRRTADILRERLKESGISNVTVVHHKGLGEIIPQNFEVKVGKDKYVMFMNQSDAIVTI